MAKRQEDFEFDEEKQPISPNKSGFQFPAVKPSTSTLREELQPIQTDQKSDHDPKKTMEKFEPESQHFNYFYVGVSGHIESGDFPFLDGLSCKYSLVYGKDWALADV